MSTFRFLPNLYIGGNLREVTKKKWFISHGIPVSSCYVIVLSHHNRTELEIMTVDELHKKFRKKDHYDVIGLSTSRHGAFTLLTDVYADVYANTGAYHVKQYFTELLG